MIVDGDKRIMTADELETFIFQAKVQEREACAKIAEDYARRAFSGPHGSEIAGVAAQHIADAIRKRNQQQ